MDSTPPPIVALDTGDASLGLCLSPYVVAVRGLHDLESTELENKVHDLLQAIGIRDRPIDIYKNVSAFLIRLSPSEAAALGQLKSVISVDLDKPIVPFSPR